MIAVQTKSILTLVIVMMLVLVGPAMADKPSWADGKDKSKNQQKHQKQEKHSKKLNHHTDYSAYPSTSKYKDRGYFNDQHRHAVKSYYTERNHAGHCPPGLAKKNNRCMPPGQTKKWHMGKQLPADVVFYDLPQDVIVQLGSPPLGHRFVRVASDILMITIGTGMVVDAIQDLSQF